MLKLIYFLVTISLSASCYSVNYPISVQSNFGNLIISKAPERIIVLEFGILDELKLLGIKPIGIGTSDAAEGNDPAYLQEFIKNIPSVGLRNQPSLEAIANLKPDLILGDHEFIARSYSQLKKIAPTLMLNSIVGSPEEQIKNLKLLAKITNTENKVPGILKTYSQIREEAITKSRKIEQKKVLIGYITPTGIFRALTANAMATPILKELNKINLISETNSSQRVEMTVEGILQINPDQIIILLTDGNINPYGKLKENPLWNEVRAFQNQQVYFMDRNIWAKTHGIEALELMYKQAIHSGFLEGLKNKMENLAL